MSKSRATNTYIKSKKENCSIYSKRRSKLFCEICFFSRRQSGNHTSYCRYHNIWHIFVASPNESFKKNSRHDVTRNFLRHWRGEALMRIMTWVPSSVHNTPKLSNKLPSEPYEVTRGVHQSSGEVEGILFKRVSSHAWPRIWWTTWSVVLLLFSCRFFETLIFFQYLSLFFSISSLVFISYSFYYIFLLYFGLSLLYSLVLFYSNLLSYIFFDYFFKILEFLQPTSDRRYE